MTSKLNEEREANARSLSKLASEREERWRAACGLTKRLNRKSNAEAMKRRQRESNPKEPKGATKYRRYRSKKLGRMGAASKVRHIDPVTGTSTPTSMP
jgi:phytoene dehydrogenase-like protein